MTIDFPILYINLDRSTDRREKMEKQFAELGVKAIRIPGVDGVRDEGKPDYPKVSKFWSWVFNGRQLTKGEIGCAASQIRAAKYIVDNNLDWALVLEDDIELAHAELEKVPTIAREANKFDAISLLTSTPRGVMSVYAPRGHKTDVFRVVGRRNLAMAQIIMNSGAKKVAKVACICTPADVFHLLEASYGLVGAFCWPNVFRLPVDINLNSVIDEIDSAVVGSDDRYKSSSAWRVTIRPLLLAWARSLMKQNNTRIGDLVQISEGRLS